MCCRYGSDHGACHAGPESRGSIATWEGTAGLVQKKKLGPRLFCRTCVVLAPAPLLHGAHPHEKPLKRPHAWHCLGTPLDPLRVVGAVQVGAAVGQRSWQACMSIIMCPHMGHSFFLPTTIHHAPGSASYYSFWQTRRLRPSGSCAPAPGSPPVCLDSRCTL